MRLIQRVLFSISLLLLLLTISLGVYTQGTLSTAPDTNFIYSTFSDNTHGFYMKGMTYTGDTKVSPVSISSDNSVSFSFVLGEEVLFSYAGVAIYLENTTFFDISSYDAIKIDLGDSTPTSFGIDISSFVEGVSEQNKDFSYRFAKADVSRKKSQMSVIVPLSELVTPDWWFEQRDFKPSDLPDRPDWRYTTTINIQSADYFKKGKEYTFVIEQVSFVRSKKPFVFALITWIVSLMFLIVIRTFRVKSEEKMQEIHYTPLEISDSCSEQFTRIINFIGEHYSEESFSIENICEFTGLSQRKVATLFKEQTGDSFKRYLNTIRLEEAKRLLLSTDKRITEIAYVLGYNYPSHFNKLFQERFGKTPSQMRESLIEDLVFVRFISFLG